MRKIGELIERFGPISAGLSCLGLLLICQEAVVEANLSQSVDFSALYGAVLDWSAIQTGFLFGIYGFVAGKNDGFVAALKNTREMKLFVGYMKWAIFIGFALTITSIPLLVLRFSISDIGEWRYWLFSCWCFLAVWGFLAFVRVAYIFGILARTKDQIKIPG